MPARKSVFSPRCFLCLQERERGQGGDVFVQGGIACVVPNLDYNKKTHTLDLDSYKQAWISHCRYRNQNVGAQGPRIPAPEISEFLTPIEGEATGRSRRSARLQSGKRPAREAEPDRYRLGESTVPRGNCPGVDNGYTVMVPDYNKTTQFFDYQGASSALRRWYDRGRANGELQPDLRAWIKPREPRRR